jgi:CIC family chloride channel protein
MMLETQSKYALVRTRRWFRGSEAAQILLAVAVGLVAGAATILIELAAHGMQHVFYGVGVNRLSALASIRHPWKLVFLPLGGLLLILANRLFSQRHAPIDVVEANALHGGRIPFFDTFRVSLQTLISNGFGASVGLEAAYAQAGGGLASLIGQWCQLRRRDLRTLAGAGAGAGIAAAFGAPLTGAFYAFEIMIGSFVPAAIAPVAAAALAGALLTRELGVEPFLIASTQGAPISNLAYVLYACFGVLVAVIGIGIIQLQTGTERLLARVPLPAMWRPLIGGLLLMPIVWLSPQALSSGHGALRLELALQPAIAFLLFVFALKVLASVISLSFGFRGGLFFASLFLGSLLGPVFAQGVNLAAGQPLLDPNDAALVGMAALAVTVVGGPMTCSLLVLETTHDFSLTGAVITATLCASAFTRTHFGYSFSTWRLHLRGTAIRSARDVGRLRALTAERLMRRDPTLIDAGLTVAQFRALVPLGATSRVVLTDNGTHYRGIVQTAQAYAPGRDPDEPVAALAQLVENGVAASTGVEAILDHFEQHGADDLAVIDKDGRVIGVLTEKYVNRRYIEESEKAQHELFGD